MKGKVYISRSPAYVLDISLTDVRKWANIVAREMWHKPRRRTAMKLILEPRKKDRKAG